MRTHSFWDVSNKCTGSWILRKLLKLRDLVAPFLRSDIGNGNTTLFCFDNWLSVGRLTIDITSDSGTRVLGIPRYAMVSTAASAGQWNIRRCRGYHLRGMIASINSVPAPVETAAADRCVWRHGEDEYMPVFSRSATWRQIRTHYPAVNWIKVVWFSQTIPRFSFIT